MAVDPDKLKSILETLQAAADRKLYHRIDFFRPYAKQSIFFMLGATKRERLLMAGNQLGKSEAGAAEMTYHLTGLYPADWKGRKWERAVRAWAAGESSLVVRDVQQKKLCGQPGVDADFGTGMIPKACLIDKSMARGVTDAFDTIQVQHHTNGVPDGISTLTFKSYEQGRTKFQGDTVDIVWGDEEPPMDVYTEMLTRVTATGGMVYITFTPLKGRSDVVIRYMDEASPDRDFVTMVIEDALHIPADKRKAIIDGYPAHEREARARGVPLLGSGRIFQISEESISVPFLEYVPPHWAKLWGIDFGIGHPFAAVLGAWDKDNDIIYILHGYRQADVLPVNHAQAMKPIGAIVPVAWPHDGNDRDKGSGEALKDQYKKQGLLMLPDYATWPDGGNSTEAGILEMTDRLMSGRLKVSAHLAEWFAEYREYHRKDGQIVKVRDDLMSATRILVMMKRFARPVALGGSQGGRRRAVEATGLDFDVFGG